MLFLYLAMFLFLRLAFNLEFLKLMASNISYGKSASIKDIESLFSVLKLSAILEGKVFIFPQGSLSSIYNFSYSLSESSL